MWDLLIKIIDVKFVTDIQAEVIFTGGGLHGQDEIFKILQYFIKN
jgi:hypothetical protein